VPITDPARVSVVSHRLALGFEQVAPTLRGQAAGLVLILLPALAHPLSLGGADGLLQLLASVLGGVGAVLVFGGMAVRTWLPERLAGQSEDDGLVPYLAKQDARARDEALADMPGARTAWGALAVLCAGLALFAVVLLVLAFADDGWERLSNAALLGIPAAALAFALWLARVMWTGLGSDEALDDETPDDEDPAPDEDEDQPEPGSSSGATAISSP